MAENMQDIASFTIDHLTLLPGVYVSRVDKDPATGAIATTFDLRMTMPNREPAMNTGACHTLEHIFATHLRNNEKWKDKIVYVGPMGCRTGFYVVMWGELTSEEVVEPIRDAMNYVASFEGEVPGARPEACGNWRDHNLEEARYEAARYVERALNDPRPEQLVYG